MLSISKNGKTVHIYIFHNILMLIGFCNLLKTDAFYAPYLLIAICGFIAGYYNYRNEYSARILLICLFSALFSSMVTFSNYRLWEKWKIDSFFFEIFVFIGVYLAFRNIFCWLFYNVKSSSFKKIEKAIFPRKLFWSFFLSVLMIDSAVLMLCKYPGVLTIDSINQLNQVFSGSYSNHHPIAHTLLIKVCVNIGLLLFNDMNAAVAVYSMVSIIVLAFVFSFSIATIKELGSSKWVVAISAIYYVCMPFHIIYSITMWKDVFFGAFVLLFLISTFRSMNGLSLKHINIVCCAVAGLGMCLFRSNGLFVFAITLLVFVVLFRLKEKKVLIMNIAVLILALIIKYPLLNVMNIQGADTIEYLSIPLQQVSRDIIDNNDFDTSDLVLLSGVMDINRVADFYDPFTSDPMKAFIREEGNQEIISLYKADVMQFYIKRVFKHPLTYIHAWIDETKGYWNSGYFLFHWALNISGNELGIFTINRVPILNRILNSYLTHFEYSPFLQLFLSIGLYTWITGIASFIAICRKDRIGIIVTTPLIINTISLLIATPVFAEFRYAYSTFCALPLVLVVVTRNIIFAKK